MERKALKGTSDIFSFNPFQQFNHSCSIRLSLSLSCIPKLKENISKVKKSYSSIGLIHMNNKKAQLSIDKEQSIIQLLMSNTTIINKTNNTIGSLLSLFNSEVFNIHLLLYYLNIKEDIGIIDMLITILHTHFQSEASYYLPQIVTIFLNKKYSTSLLQYLINTSYNSMSFGLKLQWLIRNYLIKLIDKGNKKQITEFLNKLYLIRVSTLRIRHSINIYQDNTEAKYRLMYFNKIEAFYNEMAYFYTIYLNSNEELSSGLFQALIARINIKISYLNKIALELKQYLPNSLIKNLYRGIFIPIKIGKKYVDNSVDDQQSFIIVNVIKEHSAIFKQTKRSFVVKLVIECVQVKNCEQWEKLFIDQLYLNDHPMNQLFKQNREKEKAFNPFNTQWPIIQKELISQSSFKVFNTYRLKTVLLEYNEDFSNQEIIMQFIDVFINITSKADLPLRLHKINLTVILSLFSIREYYPGFVSIKELKSQLKERKMSLNKFLRIQYGNAFEEKQKAFVESLSAYSLFCYMMNITEKIFNKMFIDNNGVIALFNFAYCFHTTNYDCINEPFIIPSDFMEVIDGKESAMFYYYKSLIIRGLLELRKHTEVFITLIQSILKTVSINNFSAKNEQVIIKSFTQRFFFKKSESELYEKIEKMINISNS